MYYNNFNNNTNSGNGTVNNGYYTPNSGNVYSGTGSTNNDCQQDYLNPQTWNQNQRDQFGPRPMSEIEFSQLGQNYNSAQADHWGLPKIDYDTYREYFNKRYNIW